jgi:hypothetical protein
MKNIQEKKQAMTTITENSLFISFLNLVILQEVDNQSNIDIFREFSEYPICLYY